MSRFIGRDAKSQVLLAAQHWKANALVVSGAVLSTTPLWTLENINALHTHFVARPDLSKGKFLAKLSKQLAEVSPDAKQLTAEMFWLLYLCPSNITVAHKRSVIDEVWSWSAAPRPESKWMSDEVLAGIGSAGPGFNQNFWRELAFLINFLIAYRSLSVSESARLMADPWLFDDFLKRVPEWESRQFRHMLLFLLFPDSFERIFGQGHRTKVLEVFGGVETAALTAMDPVEIDRALFDTRKKLEAQYGTPELDYYEPPLVGQWQLGSLSEVASAISEEHVRLALEAIDREGMPASAQSTGYDLVEGGRRYPPKLVFALATKFATGKELGRNLFTGGIDSQASRTLQKLGFEIATKDLIAPLLEKFLAQATTADQTVKAYLDEYRGLQVRVSFGQGNAARIPWIAFLKEGQAVSKGIYPVFLYFKERSTLLLCYGVSETNRPDLSWEDLPEGTRTVSEWSRAQFGVEADRYRQSFVKAAFDLREPLRTEVAKQELDELIDHYASMLGESTNDAVSVAPEPETVRAEIGEACQSFGEALRLCNVDFGRRHDEIASAFICSIVSKPLVILTGLSGSGKTQIALRFGEWLGKDRLHVAPVRPDWTGAEALFGYEDGLKPAVEGRAAWSVPAPLEFMLRAANDSSNPFLLLLDEMNLAHVERYFADVLSGMESGQPCLPNLVKGADGMWRVRSQGPDRIPLPRNLWIVGTVNVDETTYMFSPKVLDRSNTLEFRVSSEDISDSARKPTKCEVGDSALVRGLLSIGKDDEWHIAHPAAFATELQVRLRQVHSLLGQFGLEFGHRTYYEAMRFGALGSRADLSSVERVLDRVVLQKVLPRLHGSRKKLEGPTLALMHFCHVMPEVTQNDVALQSADIEAAKVEEAKLPHSFAKLARMLRSLRTNQFASFAE